ncbi:MAG: hypothetical protein AB7G93_13010 [Bdellovibrionales bacterium]
MSTKLDPTDCSKVFGSSLNDVLASVIDNEQEDFEDCLFFGNFSHLSEDDQQRLETWMTDFKEGNAEEMPRAELLRSGHIWALATVIWAMIADEEEEAQGEVCHD